MGYQVAATPGTAEYYIAQSQRPDLTGAGAGAAEKGDLTQTQTHSPPYSIRLAGAEGAVDSSALFAHIVALAKPTDSSSSASSAATPSSPSPSPSPTAAAAATAGSVLGTYPMQSPSPLHTCKASYHSHSPSPSPSFSWQTGSRSARSTW